MSMAMLIAGFDDPGEADAPTVGGVVWGAAAGIGGLAVDNPAMRALCRAIEDRRTVLVAMADEPVIAGIGSRLPSGDACRYRMPDQAMMLLDVLAGLPMEDLVRRPVPTT